jgi:hypothetical protein
MPDIYFFVLDAYAGSDVLRDVYNYDNNPFLDSLTSKGFYVVDCSQSNYSQTTLSLTSTLNLNYLDALPDNFEGITYKDSIYSWRTQNNLTRSFLHSKGYSSISFATGYPMTEWSDADYYFAPNVSGINDFEIYLVKTSLLQSMVEKGTFFKQRSAEIHRQRISSALKNLEETVPRISGPKFVFAHLVIPHVPYVFGPNGEELDYTDWTTMNVAEKMVLYRGEVTYINKRIEKVIDIILQTSSNPPIIVIQGDHGPDPFKALDSGREIKMYNLSAFYLPGKAVKLYSTITPVNTFRLILNEYFNQDYDLLPDRSYYSDISDPFNFTKIPNTCSDKEIK